MAQKVDLQERLKMRFLTVDYRDKQEVYGTSDTASDTGTIALEILNIPDYVLEDLLKLTDPMMQLVDYLNHNKNPDNSTLAMMLTASRNVFRVVDLLRDVPPFAGQAFTWLDGKLPSIFSADAVKKAYRQRKKEMGEVFIPALCLVAQLGFGIRDFRKALIPLVESLDDEEISRNPAGFAKQFDGFFRKINIGTMPGCRSPMCPWSIRPVKRDLCAGCTMLLSLVCSAPIFMKHWQQAMPPNVARSAKSSF